MSPESVVESRRGGLVSVDAVHPVAVGGIGVEDEVAPWQSELGKVVLPHGGEIRAPGGCPRPLDEKAVLGGSHDEVGGGLDGGVLEEDLETPSPRVPERR